MAPNNNTNNARANMRAKTLTAALRRINMKKREKLKRKRDANNNGGAPKRGQKNMREPQKR